jgi:hypothetical protein
MSCRIFKQSCKVQVKRFYQSDKTKSWSGLKLSSADDDWDVYLEQWLEYQLYYCEGYYCEIFKQSCKVQRFNQRDKSKSWSFLKLSSANGDGDIHKLTMNWDWNVADGSSWLIGWSPLQLEVTGSQSNFYLNKSKSSGSWHALQGGMYRSQNEYILRT